MNIKKWFLALAFVLLLIILNIKVSVINQLTILVLLVFVYINYFLMPYVFILLVIISILQFIFRNLTKYKILFIILVYILIFGHFGMICFNLSRLDVNLIGSLKNATPLFCILIFSIINEYIYRKCDSRYYLILILLLFAIYIFGINFEFLY